MTTTVFSCPGLLTILGPGAGEDAGAGAGAGAGTGEAGTEGSREGSDGEEFGETEGDVGLGLLEAGFIVVNDVVPIVLVFVVVDIVVVVVAVVVVVVVVVVVETVDNVVCIVVDIGVVVVDGGGGVSGVILVATIGKSDNLLDVVGDIVVGEITESGTASLGPNISETRSWSNCMVGLLVFIGSIGTLLGKRTFSSPSEPKLCCRPLLIPVNLARSEKQN